MFGKSKRKAVTIPTVPSDQYRLKSTGQRVTLLTRLSNGEVRIARDDDNILREAIVSIHDITPA